MSEKISLDSSDLLSEVFAIPCLTNKSKAHVERELYSLLLSDFLKVAKFQKARNKANAFYMYCHTRILSDGMTYCTEE